MQGKTHILFGLFLAVVLWSFFGLEFWTIVFAGLGSILPDLDYAKNFQKFHRKLFHNVWFVLFIFWISSRATGQVVALGLLVGVVSHLIADSLTPTGVWPFWPVKGIHLSFNDLSGISTGRRSEFCFYLLILFSTILILYREWRGSIWSIGTEDIVGTMVLGLLAVIIVSKRKEIFPGVYRG